LAGTVNTGFVAALTAVGVAAVGLTGADAACGLSAAAPPHRTIGGELVDLGRVGVPTNESNVQLLHTLLRDGFVPVVACIGIDAGGRLLNVNADTLAGHLAARLGARRLVIAGTTAGVLGRDGTTVGALQTADVENLLADGTATAGMVAKLRACQKALASGVDDVVIVNGRDLALLGATSHGELPSGATRLVS